jgi:hypothetical protein
MLAQTLAASQSSQLGKASLKQKPQWRRPGLLSRALPAAACLMLLLGFGLLFAPGSGGLKLPDLVSYGALQAEESRIFSDEMPAEGAAAAGVAADAEAPEDAEAPAIAPAPDSTTAAEGAAAPEDVPTPEDAPASDNASAPADTPAPAPEATEASTPSASPAAEYASDEAPHIANTSAPYLPTETSLATTLGHSGPARIVLAIGLIALGLAGIVLWLVVRRRLRQKPL